MRTCEEQIERLATEVTLQSFMNSYIREMNPGEWVNERPFDASETSSFYWMKPYLIEIKRRSIIGRHEIGMIREETKNGWREVSAMSCIITCCIKLQDQHPDQTDLLFRVLDSHRTVQLILEEQLNAQEQETFIDYEQRLWCGHWFHPTPKSRVGMTDWQQKAYAPEFRQPFQLHYFTVHETLLEERSGSNETISQLMKNQLANSIQATAQERVIPSHPLQAEHLLRQPTVKQWIEQGILRYIGASGPLYNATSSIRTVEALDRSHMLKLSIPVQVTNSRRVNKRHELEAGYLMYRLFHHLSLPDTFDLIHDPAYLAIRTREETGFEVILREPAPHAVNVAALVQPALPDSESLLMRLIRQSGSIETEHVTRWWKQYLELTLGAIVTLYEEQGIGLEAHQQNSLITFEDGWPVQYHVRDNQGYYLADTNRDSFILLEPELKHTTLFYPEEVIAERLTYYMIWNHLASVIDRLAADTLLNEEVAIALLHEWCQVRVESLEGRGRAWLLMLLESPTLPYKANLLTRLKGLDELEVEGERVCFVELDNPLREDNYALRQQNTHLQTTS